MFFRYMEVRDVEEIWEMDQALFGSMAYSRQDFLRKKGILPRSGRGCHPHGKDDTINYVRIMFTGNRRNDAPTQALAHQLNVTL